MKKTETKRLIRQCFDDTLQFAYLGPGEPGGDAEGEFAGYRMRHAIGDDFASVYQVSSTGPSLVELHGSLYFDHDNRETASRIEPLKKLLRESHVAFESPDQGRTVIVDRHAFESFIAGSVAPRNDGDLITLECRMREHPRFTAWYKQDGYHSPSVIRKQYRRAAFKIDEIDLRLHSKIDGLASFPNAAKLVTSDLFDLDVYFRPCDPDKLERMFPLRSVISPQYGFEALHETNAYDTPASLAIIAERDGPQGTDRGTTVTTRSALQVLDHYDYLGRRQVTLLVIDRRNLDFYRSASLGIFDQLVQEAREWFRAYLPARMNRPDNRWTEGQRSGFETAIYTSAQRSLLMPLFAPP